MFLGPGKQGTSLVINCILTECGRHMALQGDNRTQRFQLLHFISYFNAGDFGIAQLHPQNGDALES